VPRSGCITSAESVLITAQSQEELYKVLRENKSSGDASARKTVVVSLSPQSVAALATKSRVGMDVATRRLVTFLKSLGVDYVFDTVFAREFALRESAAELVRRIKVCADWLH
jgi:iron only hydrogenase large subunit-like protein